VLLTCKPLLVVAATLLLFHLGNAAMLPLLGQSLVALPLRGALASVVTDPIGLVPVQILDGVGAGLLGVAVPGLVARILDGHRSHQCRLGDVMAMQGVGASLSPALSGWIAGIFGYGASFLGLDAIAGVALALWVVARAITADACAGTARTSATA
jgi:MFS family permease